MCIAACNKTCYILSMPYHMTQWYIFTPLKKADIGVMRQELQELGAAHDMCGLILIAKEGCNGTVAGSKEAMQIVKSYIGEKLDVANFQDWESEIKPFRRFKVDIRNEIVALKKPVSPPPPPPPPPPPAGEA